MATRITGSKFQLATICQYWADFDYPEETSEAAREGQRKHAIVEAYIKAQETVDEPWFWTAKSHIDSEMPEGTTFTEVAFALSPKGEVKVLNPKFPRDYSEAADSDLVMTVDLIVVQDDRVVVWDWKTGKHLLGSAAESMQLTAGAISSCLHFGKRKASIAYKYLWPKTVVTASAEMESRELKLAYSRLIQLRKLDREPHPGEHCDRLWCPLRGSCKAWRKSGTFKNEPEIKEENSMGKMTLKSISKGKPSPYCVWVYGKGGIGKTTFGVEAPDSIFIECEPGGLDRYPQADAFPLPDCFGDILEACDELAKPNAFKTVVIDTLDAIELFIRGQIVHDTKKPFDEDFGRGIKMEIPYWLELKRRLDILRAKGMNIILLSHANVKPRKDPIVESFESWVPSLPPVVTDIFRNWCSALLYASYEMYAKKEGTGISAKTKGVSDGKRVLYTDERAGYSAKNRYGLPAELPLSWAEFQTAASAGRIAEASVLKTEIAKAAEFLSEEKRAKSDELLAKAGDDSILLEKLLNWVLVNKKEEETSNG